MVPKLKTKEDFKNLLRQYLKDAVLVWVGQKPLDAMGLSDFISIKGIISCFWGKEVEYFKNVPFIKTIEKNTYHRKHWSNRDVPRLLSRINDLSKLLKVSDEKIYILPYRGSKKFDYLAKRKKWKILAIDGKNFEFLDNKINLIKILKELKIDPIPGESLDITKISYHQIVKKYGPKFVIQRPISSGGAGTVFITNKNEYEKYKRGLNIRNKVQKIKVCKFIEGPSLFIHGCATQNGTVHSLPGYMIIGAPQVIHLPAGFCGNQIIKGDPNEKIKSSMFSFVKKIGDFLYQRFNYRGMFGIDLIVEKKTQKVYITELNPRFLGSSQFLTSVFNKLNKIPLPIFHILEHLGIKYEFDVGSYNQQMLNNTINAFQLYLHNISRKKVKVKGEIKPGIYEFKKGTLQFKRKGYMIEHCNKNEYLLTGGVPPKNLVIDEDSIILIIQGFNHVYNPDNNSFSSTMQNLINKVYSNLNLIPLK